MPITAPLGRADRLSSGARIVLAAFLAFVVVMLSPGADARPWFDPSDAPVAISGFVGPDVPADRSAPTDQQDVAVHETSDPEPTLPVPFGSVSPALFRPFLPPVAFADRAPDVDPSRAHRSTGPPHV